jgi:hypothetical protein
MVAATHQLDCSAQIAAALAAIETVAWVRADERPELERRAALLTQRTAETVTADDIPTEQKRLTRPRQRVGGSGEEEQGQRSVELTDPRW